MSDASDPLVFVVAGELSGDVLGGRLIGALKARSDGRLRLAGIGGPAMAAQGLQSLFPMRELSLIGIVEIVPHIPRLLRRLDETAKAIAEMQPNIVVTIDSPGFSFRLARRIRRLGVPIVHYVAPQLWAWRPQRARAMAQLVDLFMAILPFEPEFFAGYGIDCTYVGHPAVEQGYGSGDGRAFRDRHAIPKDATVLAVLPGSRHGEIERLLPVIRGALDLIAARTNNLAVVIPTNEAVRDEVAREVSTWPWRSVLVTETDEQPDAYAACDAAITKSGTSTLHLALAGVPMVVCYKVNRLTGLFARRLINLDHVALANLLARHKVIPELLQDECTAQNVAREILGLLSDPSRKASQIAALKEVSEVLRVEGEPPSSRAARVVWDRLMWQRERADRAEAVHHLS